MTIKELDELNQLFIKFEVSKIELLNFMGIGVCQMGMLETMGKGLTDPKLSALTIKRLEGLDKEIMKMVVKEVNDDTTLY